MEGPIEKRFLPIAVSRILTWNYSSVTWAILPGSPYDQIITIYDYDANGRHLPRIRYSITISAYLCFLFVSYPQLLLI